MTTFAEIKAWADELRKKQPPSDGVYHCVVHPDNLDAAIHLHHAGVITLEEQLPDGTWAPLPRDP